MRNRIIIILCLFLGTGLLYSQEVKLKLTLYDAYGKPMVNTPVNFIEIETRELITIKTDATGTLNAHLTHGKLWQINILKISNNHMWQVVMPTIKAIAEQQRKITYDYEKWQRENRPAVDRKSLKLEEIKNTNKNLMPDRVNGYVKVSVAKFNKTPVKNFPVSLTCYKLGKIFTSETNQMGIAYFLVPVNQEYQLDIGGIENFAYLDLPNRPGVTVMKDITFEPCTTPEIISGDTIIQQFASEPQPCSGRQAFSLTITETGKGLYAGKEIYIRQIQSGKIYKTKTNAQGIARLLLPFGFNYELIDKEDDLLSRKIPIADLTRAFGKSSGNNSIMIEPKKVKRTTKLKITLPEKDSSLIKHFAAKGIQVTGFRKTGTAMYDGTYVLYVDAANTIGIESGLLLTTGSVENALGPNDSPGASTGRDWNHSVEPDLDKLSNTHDGGNFYDACILEIDVIPSTNKITFEYLIGSEEYGEFLQYDDAFAILFGEKGGEKTMISKIDGTTQKISVSNVNVEKHANHYHSNEKADTPMAQTWQYDGFTQKFTSEQPVVAGKKYTIKLILADYHDNIYDTGAFVNFK